MKIETLSIVAGGRACNAHCPFCVSKMTPTNDMQMKSLPINWHRFDTALRLANKCNVTTAMVTGKGEPLLWEDDVFKYIDKLNVAEMPFIELQTNGILLTENNLSIMRGLGLTTVCVSCVSYDTEKNRANYNKNYRPLEETIKMVHEAGLSIRLSVVVIKNHIDTAEELLKMANFAKTNKAEQLTFTPVSAPYTTIDEKISDWAKANKTNFADDAQEWLKAWGCHRLMVLPHGAAVYDLNGQNVCISNCLKLPDKSETLRNLIFDGEHIRYDWQFEGAILL